MYSNICYNILSSILTPRYVILLRLRLVYDLFLLFRTQKGIQKQEKSALQSGFALLTRFFKWS